MVDESKVFFDNHLRQVSQLEKVMQKTQSFKTV